jgi:alkanesulfonate monooxygenase SsuD/methylene tetrahydromethanopterin reductase-like flavin-dependent oxidoreductase (luciferase family)
VRCAGMWASTSTISIGTSVRHFRTRHPIVLASWAATMQAMTGGRFLFGFGRSTPRTWQTWGVPIPSIDSMRDSATFPRLWKGEAVDNAGPGR